MSTCTPGHREACWTARTPKAACDCNCGGENHGIHADAPPETQEDLFMDLQALTTFTTIDEFYDAHEPARLSGESDYGVWWRDDDGGIWRVSYVHATGHVYAIRSRAGLRSGSARIGGQAVAVVSVEHEGPVVILGKLEPRPELDTPRGCRKPDPAETVFEGWAERCGEQGSLAWACARIRGASVRT